MSNLSRREVLGAAATAGVAGFAGCLDAVVQSGGNTGQGDEENDDGTGGSDDNGNGEPNELNIVDVAVETVESNCLQDQKEETDVEIEDEVVTITGVRTAPNPCHVAVVEADVEGATLAVDVDVERDEGDEECIQCVGVIEYEAQVELTSDGIEHVDVSHVGDSEMNRTGESTDESEPDISVESVETVGTGCASAGESVEAITEDDGLLILEATTQAPNPCHEAVVTDVAVSNGEITLVVDTESTLSEGEFCQECLGEISYEVVIDLDGAEIADVTVGHTTGERHTSELD